MNAPDGTPRRLIILLISLSAVALGFLLPGVAEQGIRLFHPPVPDPTLPPAYQESRVASEKMVENLRRLGETHHWEHVVAQADRYCGQEDCTIGIRAMRAEALTYLGRDTEAVAAWKTVYTNLGPAYDAPLLILEGRIAEYEALCDSLLAALPADKPDLASTRIAVWISLLLPAPPNAERLLVLARYADREQHGHRQAGGSLLAAALIRANRPQEALHTLEDISTLPQLHALRALALRQQGRLGEAHQETRLFKMKLDETYGIPSRQRVELLLLLKELDSPPVEGK